MSEVAQATIGERYTPRAAHRHWEDVVAAAETGAVPVIEADHALAVVDADILDELLADQATFHVGASITDREVSLWLDDGLVHATGTTFDAAAAAFLDALVDYAHAWLTELRDAPNHAHNRFRVQRIALHADDRGRLEAVVFAHDDPARHAT